MEKIIVFGPLLAAIVGGFGWRIISERGAQFLTTGLVFLAAILSWVLFLTYDGEAYRVPLMTWLESGTLYADWSLRIDRLTTIMLIVVNTVSALVHLYSFGYMAHDDNFGDTPYRARFFAYLSFFTFTMLMLVTSDNLLQMFFGWEGVGVASYLLIGFYYKKQSAGAAAMKAFIVNRIGDFGLITAMGLMPLPASMASPLLRRWRGAALGGPASIAVHHPDPGEADRLIERCVAEIGRLESIFSLYRPDSTLCRLNREGHLDGPPSDLVVLLSDCVRFSRLTGGAFDVTVQPLWQLYADHFSRADAAADGPGRDALECARALVGYGGLLIDADRIAFAKSGMAVTLNGIAQGFITDRVVAVLRSGGCDSVLADLGEIRALGTHPSGQAWRVGLADPWVPDRIARTLEVADRAVATSAVSGFQFDTSGRFHHLLDPVTGISAARYASVSVVARDATTADALSTALTLMPIAEADRVLRETAGSVALLTYPDGKTQTHKGDRSAS